MRWIGRCHEGRGFDHASRPVEAIWALTGRLPMTPEVIVPGGYPLAQDPALSVVRAPPGRLFEAVSDFVVRRGSPLGLRSRHAMWKTP